MLEFKAKYARDIYWPQLLHIKDHGEYVETRGRKTLELYNAVTTIEEPWHHCILLPSRRWNPWLALSEALWILAGRDDIAALKPYNQRILHYSDDGRTLYGAYGARIRDQIDPLIDRLRGDPSDRRGVVSIWDKRYDLEAVTKDPPCNDMLFFKLRNNKLHMTVMCRSNDIHWGLYAVNIPTFGLLQEYIAARLGVGVGLQQHLSNSLHFYTDESSAVEITDRMLYREAEEAVPVYPKHELAFTPNEWLINYESHKGFATACSAVLEDVPIGSGWWDVVPFLGFARDFLRQYRNQEWHPEDISFADHYPDWIMAGQMFVDKVWRKEKVNA